MVHDRPADGLAGWLAGGALVGSGIWVGGGLPGRTVSCMYGFSAEAFGINSNPEAMASPVLRALWCVSGAPEKSMLDTCEGDEMPMTVYTCAGGDNGIVHNKNWLRFTYVFIFSRSHDLPPHPHPYAYVCMIAGPTRWLVASRPAP